MVLSAPNEIKLEISLPEQILIPQKEQSRVTPIEISLHLTSTPWRFKAS